MSILNDYPATGGPWSPAISNGGFGFDWANQAGETQESLQFQQLRSAAIKKLSKADQAMVKKLDKIHKARKK